MWQQKETKRSLLEDKEPHQSRPKNPDNEETNHEHISGGFIPLPVSGHTELGFTQLTLRGHTINITSYSSDITALILRNKTAKAI